MYYLGWKVMASVLQLIIEHIILAVAWMLTKTFAGKKHWWIGCFVQQTSYYRIKNIGGLVVNRQRFLPTMFELYNGHRSSQPQLLTLDLDQPMVEVNDYVTWNDGSSITIYVIYYSNCYAKIQLALAWLNNIGCFMLYVVPYVGNFVVEKIMNLANRKLFANFTCQLLCFRISVNWTCSLFTNILPSSWLR